MWVWTSAARVVRRGLPWLVVIALVSGSCDVQVRERFRTEDSGATGTTIVEDEAVVMDGATTSTPGADSVRGITVPREVLEGSDDKISVLGRLVDMRAVLEWSQTFTARNHELEFDSLVELDLTLLRVDEQERLGILSEGEAPDPQIRWYSVTGTVRHDVNRATCIPTEGAEACKIAFITDGAVYGLASRTGETVVLAILWQDVGRSGQLAVSALAVDVRDGRGETSTVEHNVLLSSLERARVVGGSSITLTAGDDEGRLFRIPDGQGRLTVFDVG